MSTKATPRPRNYTPPDIAAIYRVGTNKVIEWIRLGELQALNLARRGCSRPRYSITPEALEAFNKARQVIPTPAGPSSPRVRRKSAPGVREYF